MMTGAKPLHCGIYQIKRRTTVLDTTVARLFKPYNKQIRTHRQSAQGSDLFVVVDRRTRYTNTLRKKIRVILISTNDALTQLFRRVSGR